MSGDVHELMDNQVRAADPQHSVWLSASAGTGKTQVLSARVLRLLLNGNTDPSQILCLTFTKAGAAEMAQRINQVLARWVRLKPERLAKELGHIGADIGPETQERARTLFASVLDCPGGGLRIDTIHAFAQWLLANFPSEADLVPGARPIEDREREILARKVLGEMLEEAEGHQDRPVLDAVAQFTCRKDPDALRKWLMRCANARELWFGPGAWQPPLQPRVLRLLGLPEDTDEAQLEQMCDPRSFDDEALRRCLAGYRRWKSAASAKAIPVIEQWLASGPAARVEQLEALGVVLFHKNGNPILPKAVDDDFADASARAGAALAAIDEFRRLLDLAAFLLPSLDLGRRFALRWDEAKAREGLLDFDDLIHRAADLLRRADMADWIRYKLDRRFDHVLVDEAQDTNAAQWQIIDALIDDFFAGEGAHGDRLRTIFTVGDYKQAIFGFQGTSPDNFHRARQRVRTAMEALAGNAAEIRRNTPQRELQDLDLGRSYRTAQSVLTFVDRSIEAVGWQALGLDREPAQHEGEERPGLVMLWAPVRSETGTDADESDEASEPGEAGEEGWLSRHDRAMADKIAEQVHRWMTSEPFVLIKRGLRNARPGDVMVLVRKRKELAALIVARLHARGVPVAGVDRLRLGAPLAVKDLMAALRFAAQPLDDLNLANLLASPLVGWSQGDLLAHVPRPKEVRLWHHLRGGEDPLVAQTVAQLRQLLALADFETPQALLQWLLVGPWRGREKLVARLGREANDPIDELVNAAFDYEAGAAPSLAGFIQWFDASSGELKRDPGGASDQVRVMTVHGSKGLEAPIVILADATGKPGQGGDLTLEEISVTDARARTVPLPVFTKEERIGPIESAAEASKIAELQEHWRLLYVAMTRAEEALFIGGSLGPREKEPHPDSWYARIAPVFDGEPLPDDLWNVRYEWGYRAPPVAGAARAREEKPDIPDWARVPVGPEPRPPRPLAPSAAGEDQSADPPLAPDLARVAARRGVLIHRLLERLPEIAVDAREQLAGAWLARQAAELDHAARAEIVQCALAVIDDPGFADVFSPLALAEVPLAAVVGGEVVAGTADRLLVEAAQVTVVDFKTARRPPATLGEIPESTLRQMAAYAGALEAIYPGRTVRAAVIYTQTPQLIEIPAEVIERHKRGLSSAQESF
ncbi:MAG: double-strand break repair helicase AddA [Erythrobacter sp.]|nr:double-strand break repair helicase AddA [Erythrobacter sp.]